MNDGSPRETTAWPTRLRAHLPVGLVWLCLLVLPIGRAVEVPVMLMAIAGVYLCARKWRALVELPAIRLFMGIFLLAWIPILVSLPDAVRYQSTGMMSINHLRFAFSGIFVIYVLSSREIHGRFLTLCAWLLLLWVLDGIVQLIVGRDLVGFAVPASGQVNALFGESGLVYGILLAVLCPLLWEHAGRHWAPWQAAAVVIATLIAILAAGTRSAWISVFVILLAYGVVLWRRRGRFPAGLVVVTSVGVVVAIGALWIGSPRFVQRIENAVGAFTGATAVESDAIGHRAWIWRGAVNMIRDNPVNGVGAGGFRYAFSDYAAPGDPFFYGEPPINPSHSHQLWLEILAETGLVGAVGLLGLLCLLGLAGIRAPPEGRRLMLPYGLSLLAAYFPLNTHMAIYSSFWSQIVWWLIALYCAAYGVANRPVQRPGSAGDGRPADGRLLTDTEA